jgi:hypothetical protein
VRASLLKGLDKANAVPNGQSVCDGTTPIGSGRGPASIAANLQRSRLEMSNCARSTTENEGAIDAVGARQSSEERRVDADRSARVAQLDAELNGETAGERQEAAPVLGREYSVAGRMVRADAKVRNQLAVCQDSQRLCVVTFAENS